MVEFRADRSKALLLLGFAAAFVGVAIMLLEYSGVAAVLALAAAVLAGRAGTRSLRTKVAVGDHGVRIFRGGRLVDEMSWEAAQLIIVENPEPLDRLGAIVGMLGPLANLGGLNRNDRRLVLASATKQLELPPIHNANDATRLITDRFVGSILPELQTAFESGQELRFGPLTIGKLSGLSSTWRSGFVVAPEDLVRVELVAVRNNLAVSAPNLRRRRTIPLRRVVSWPALIALLETQQGRR